MYVWRIEVYFNCLPQSLPTLLVDIGFSLIMELIQDARPTSSRDLTVSPAPVSDALELDPYTTVLSFHMPTRDPNPGPSWCLYNRHLID